MSLATPSFRASNCTRFRFRYSECSRCADACPHEAITLSDEGAAVDAGKCQHCGLCVSACHTGSWSSASFKLIDLLRQAIRQPSWSIACAPSGAKADAIVPCLGAVDGIALAYLAKRCIPVTLLGNWHCTECPHGKTEKMSWSPSRLSAPGRARCYWGWRRCCLWPWPFWRLP